MKQKDIALIIIIVFVSGVASFLVSNWLFGSDKHTQKVETVEAITADFPTPDQKYFNNQSIDPTQLIQIGQSTNPNPFTGATQ